ncbi:MAG: PH domain-containing protein [Dehalococcoidia bacterium]|nr:PH domain-containing protein [Dehalococcoidia bacterium]
MPEYAGDMHVDKKDQLEKIEAVCLPDELIRAVFDLKGRGTGFLGITDRRIVYYDKEWLKSKKALVSIPFSRISSVASEDSKGFFITKGFFVSDTLAITISGQGTKLFEFRGGDKAHLAHMIIMEHILS